MVLFAVKLARRRLTSGNETGPKSSNRLRHRRRDDRYAALLRPPPEAARADGEHDLFGDGSVVLLPTYGHPRAISRCGCGSPPTTSCWPATAAISAAPCASGGCRVL